MKNSGTESSSNRLRAGLQLLRRVGVTGWVRRGVVWLLALTALLIIAGGTGLLERSGTGGIGQSNSGAGAPDQESYGRLPLYFVENRGQIGGPAAYYLQGVDAQVYFTPQGLTYRLLYGHRNREQEERPRVERASLKLDRGLDQNRQVRKGWVIRLEFVGAREVRPEGEAPTEAVVSYFQGRPEKWQTGLKTYAQLVYRDLWPGIDLIYSGDNRRLKYTFRVHPGADPRQIRLAYRGLNRLSVDARGELEIATAAGLLREEKPYVYQQRKNGPSPGTASDASLFDRLRAGLVSGNGSAAAAPAAPIQSTQSIPVEAAYEVGIPDVDGGMAYGFRIGNYDPTRELIIDPVTLVYCGYIGGISEDWGFGIAVDSGGNAYVAGRTYSNQSTFPITVGPDVSFNDGIGSFDGFVAKVNATGTALAYCGYIGGYDNDEIYGIAVDSGGNAYVTGWTNSNQSTFPIKVGPGLINKGTDAFVAKLNPAGTALVYCGYIAGNSIELGAAVAVDSGGNAYVTGWTQSDQSSFPVKVGPYLTYHSTWQDAFVAKVNSAGTALDYCGYIGGSGHDYGWGIAVDAGGDAYIAGQTDSDQSTFPVTVGPDLSYNGGTSGWGDAFVAKVNAAGTALAYCGYIGGSDNDWASAIAVDTGGSAYSTGWTYSNQGSFPETVGPDLTYNGGGDAFIAKVNSAGTALSYCGYIGGIGSTGGDGVAVDSSGNAYISGYTNSDQGTFPINRGPDLSYNSGGDAFIAKVNSAGTALSYCGYIGGSNEDWAHAAAIDTSGNAYITGYTYSTQSTFPVTVGPDPTFNDGTGHCDAFVARITVTPDKLFLPLIRK